MKRNKYTLYCWMALLLFVVITRLYGLGQRAMSHDESLHTYYSWVFADTGDYRHDPMMHGPLLFHINAMVYATLGDSEFTSRLAPALFGIFLIAMVYPFKRYMGQRATFFAAALLAIAPDILFYSRYIRNEIYISFLLLAWIYCLFRYIEKPATHWLLLTAVAAGFSTACKEVSFMHAALLFGFLSVSALPSIIKQRSLLNNPRLDMAILTGACLLPFTCPFLHYILQWDPLDQSPQGQLHTLVLAGSLVLSGLIAGTGWFRINLQSNSEKRPGPLAFGIAFFCFWFINLILYTTVFTQPLSGAASGFAGGLGYWLSQHHVQRGSQPLYYYIMLLLLYNAGLLICALCGFVPILRGLIRRTPKNMTTLFSLFIGWWTLGTFCLYTIAGERMPWLLVHISLPMCFLGAIWLNNYLSPISWREAFRTRTILLILFIPTLIYLLFHIPSYPIWQGRTIAAIQHTATWYRAGAALLLLSGIAILTLFRKGHPAYRFRIAVTGFLALLFLSTLTAGLRLAFVNYDLPTEHLVFAHGSNAIHPLFSTIERIHRKQYNPKAPVLAYDQESSWPLTWYARNLPHKFFIKPDHTILKSPVIICGNKTLSEVRQLTAGLYTETRQTIIWWPVQGYMNQTPSSLHKLLTDPVALQQLIDIMIHRRFTHPLDLWPLRHDAYVFIRNDKVDPSDLLASNMKDPSPSTQELVPAHFGQKILLYPEQIYDGTYDSLPLSQPRNACMLTDGSLVITDTGNNRIVALNQNGTLRKAFTSHPPLKEPWGITADAQNNIYVTDTWSGKVRAFDSSFEPRAFWGIFAQAADILSDPMFLYGPRGLAMVPGADTLAIADTGNRRILLYTTDGQFIKAYGAFSEPVNVSFAPDSTLMAVAEIWRQRIVLINLKTDQKRYIDVPYWTGQDASFKPFAAIDKAHRLYAAAPAQHCVVVYAEDGTPLFHFGEPGAGPSAMIQPTGLTITPDNRHLLVADSGNNRILVYRVDQLKRDKIETLIEPE